MCISSDVPMLTTASGGDMFVFLRVCLDRICNIVFSSYYILEC